MTDINNNEQTQILHECLEKLSNLSSKLELFSFRNPIKSKVVDNLELNQFWLKDRIPLQTLKEAQNLKRFGKSAEDQFIFKTIKKRQRFLRDQNKIDYSLDYLSSINIDKKNFILNSGFYNKYKNLIRTISSKKKGSLSPRSSKLTKEQLRLKVSNSITLTNPTKTQNSEPTDQQIKKIEREKEEEEEEEEKKEEEENYEEKEETKIIVKKPISKQKSTTQKPLSSKRRVSVKILSTSVNSKTKNVQLKSLPVPKTNPSIPNSCKVSLPSNHFSKSITISSIFPPINSSKIERKPKS